MIFSELQRYASGRNIDSSTGVSEWQVLYAATALLILTRSRLPTTDPIVPNEAEEVSLQSLHEAACNRLSPLLPDAAETGLSVDDNVRAFTHSFVGNTDELNKLVNISESVLMRDAVRPSVVESNLREMKQRHKKLVKRMLKEVPKSEKPTMTIVAGPYAGGKSELIELALNDKSVLVIDLDRIRELLMEGYDPSNQDHVAKVREESWIVSDLLLRAALQSKRSVVIQTSLHRASRWLNDKSLKYARSHRIPIQLKMILRPVSDCILRNWHRDRKVALKDLLDSMNGMTVLVDLVKKFGKSINVQLYDFYPLLKKQHGITSLMFAKQYGRLIRFAKTRKNIKVINQLDDLAVLTAS